MRTLEMLALLGLSACTAAGAPSSSVRLMTARYPVHPVTLSVSNNTGLALELGALPLTSVAIPTPSLGLWVLLKTVGPGSNCAPLPDSMLISVGPVGGVTTDSVVWTSMDSMEVFAFDSMTGAKYLTSVRLVPAGSAGWSITIPSVNGAVSAAAPCTL